MNDYKVCGKCKQEKHIDDFYKRHNGGALTDCKECHKIRSRNQVQSDRRIAVNKSEMLVIDRLKEMRIPALPGKALGYVWADVVAWGCVLIECKYSKDKGAGFFQWGFSPLQIDKGLRAHLVVLCCDYEEMGITYHVFNVNDPVFYHSNGERKTGVAYEVNARHRRMDRVVLTDRMMSDHQDQWQLVEHARQDVSLQLAAGMNVAGINWRIK